MVFNFLKCSILWQVGSYVSGYAVRLTVRIFG
jgi:hypothetical protein